MTDLRIFGLGTSLPYADAVCQAKGWVRTQHIEEYQDDGEPYVRSLENVRGCDVFVIQSLYNCERERLADKVMKLLFFARSLRDASARRVTLVCPYLAYQRQDRKTESRAPVYTKYFPEMVEGVLRPDDRILTIDAHNLSAFQSGFRIMIDHLEAKSSYGEWFEKHWMEMNLDLENLVAASPDEGGVKRAGFYRKKTQAVLKNMLGRDIPMGLAAVYKERKEKFAEPEPQPETKGKKKPTQEPVLEEVETFGIMGDVDGKDVLMFDDMISTASTAVKAVKRIHAEHGRVKAFCATHGLCVDGLNKEGQITKANDKIAAMLDLGVRVIITDTVEPMRLTPETKARLTVIPTHGLVAEAIRCIHNEESVSQLLR